MTETCRGLHGLPPESVETIRHATAEEVQKRGCNLHSVWDTERDGQGTKEGARRVAAEIIEGLRNAVAFAKGRPEYAAAERWIVTTPLGHGVRLSEDGWTQKILVSHPEFGANPEYEWDCDWLLKIPSLS